jgi:hypothetical protein
MAHKQCVLLSILPYKQTTKAHSLANIFKKKASIFYIKRKSNRALFERVAQSHELNVCLSHHLYILNQFNASAVLNNDDNKSFIYSFN